MFKFVKKFVDAVKLTAQQIMESVKDGTPAPVKDALAKAAAKINTVLPYVKLGLAAGGTVAAIVMAVLHPVCGLTIIAAYLGAIIPVSLAYNALGAPRHTYEAAKFAVASATVAAVTMGGPATLCLAAIVVVAYAGYVYAATERQSESRSHNITAACSGLVGMWCTVVGLATIPTMPLLALGLLWAGVVAAGTSFTLELSRAMTEAKQFFAEGLEAIAFEEVPESIDGLKKAVAKFRKKMAEQS
jgi:hypothetical protein